eukprot:801579_1
MALNISTKTERLSMTLVDGFIHCINDSLSQIIPSVLNQLCFAYFDIEPIECLNDKRLKAKEANDIQQTQQFEQLIVFEVCIRVDKDPSNAEILRAILNAWRKQNQIPQFKSHIIECIRKCVQTDNVEILRIMLKHCEYARRTHIAGSVETQNEMIGFINTAAKYGSFSCISVLLRNPEWFDWTLIRQPICLLNAVRHHHHNLDLIAFIISQLENVKKCLFVCDDVMKEVIRNDLVHVAKRIMDNRCYLYTFSEEDARSAELINLKCNELFKAKYRLKYYNENDIEESWVVSDDDSEFEDNTEWQNGICQLQYVLLVYSRWCMFKYIGAYMSVSNI